MGYARGHATRVEITISQVGGLHGMECHQSSMAMPAMYARHELTWYHCMMSLIIPQGKWMPMGEYGHGT